MNKTGIEYLDFTWNPVTGCTHGCPECWAREVSQKRLAPACESALLTSRHRGGVTSEAQKLLRMKEAYHTFAPTLHPERLDQPARRKKSAVIGVCFMGDLFDPKSTVTQNIVMVANACRKAEQHTYVFLTKRPHVMACAARGFLEWPKPQPNWYLGFSARTQSEFDAGWPHMAKLAAAGWKVWVSLEPMQEAIDLDCSLPCVQCGLYTDAACPSNHGSYCLAPKSGRGYLSSVIVGAQSPTGPWDDAWARAIRDQCAAAKVPYMLKQGLDARGKIVKLPMLDGRRHDDVAWRKK